MIAAQLQRSIVTLLVIWAVNPLFVVAQPGLIIYTPYADTQVKPGDSVTIQWDYFPSGSPGIMGEEVIEFNLQDLRDGAEVGVPLTRLAGSFAAKLKTATVTIPTDVPSGAFVSLY
ncbi:hypothetical protein BC829DRAFT_390747 [Chytridium lagenaria]|nr:hypothetical protein BC829DRAFT_390747 [Chytridium lagenaria]